MVEDEGEKEESGKDKGVTPAADTEEIKEEDDGEKNKEIFKN